MLYSSIQEFDNTEKVLRRALEFAERIHSGQKRKSGEPYIVHPLEVCRILGEWNLDIPALVAGLLHDTLEDSDDFELVKKELLEEFGEEITHLVEGVSKVSKVSLDRSRTDQAENYRRMFLAMSKDIRVILVKFADRLHNMRTLKYLPPMKRKKIGLETREIYVPLAARMGMYELKSELDDLSFFYLKPETYRKIEKSLDELKGKFQVDLDEIEKVIRNELRERFPTFKLKRRIKSIASLYQKMNRYRCGVEQIDDIFAFRVIVSSKEECYETLGVLHNCFVPIPGKLKDYVALPKENGYQSIHTILVSTGGMKFEVQIRNEEMDRIAEQGIAAHWIYKEGPVKLESLIEKFSWLRNLVEWQKSAPESEDFMENLKIDLFDDMVYVYTPRGDVKELPRGSTPIDLAYSIHSEIGNHIQGAKVNNRLVPIKTTLQTGDVVEILTSTRAHPSPDWLYSAKTPRARYRIKQYIKMQEYDRNLELGRVRLMELMREKTGEKVSLDNLNLKRVARELGLHTTNDLLAGVGYGTVSLKQLEERLLPKETKTVYTRKNFDQAGVVSSVKGMDGMLVKWSRCCNPLPGEKIVGYVTRGKGIAIHSADCPNLAATDPAGERVIELEWDDENINQIFAGFDVVSENKIGLLSEMTEIISREGGNILNARIHASRPDEAHCTFFVQVKDRDRLKVIARQIKNLDGVIGVFRSGAGKKTI